MLAIKGKSPISSASRKISGFIWKARSKSSRLLFKMQVFCS